MHDTFIATSKHALHLVPMPQALLPIKLVLIIPAGSAAESESSAAAGCAGTSGGASTGASSPIAAMSQLAVCVVFLTSCSLLVMSNRTTDKVPHDSKSAFPNCSSNCSSKCAVGTVDCSSSHFFPCPPARVLDLPYSKTVVDDDGHSLHRHSAPTRLKCASATVGNNQNRKSRTFNMTSGEQQSYT